MKLIRNGSQPSIKGGEANFTGDARIDCVFPAAEPLPASARVVTFEPGARTRWHTHPLGQILIVTSGVGWTCCEGEPKVEIRAGDIVGCPAKHRHWHGATATTAMTHIAITGMLEGREVEWMEPVSDEDFLSD